MSRLCDTADADQKRFGHFGLGKGCPTPIGLRSIVDGLRAHCTQDASRPARSGRNSSLTIWCQLGVEADTPSWPPSGNSAVNGVLQEPIHYSAFGTMTVMAQAGGGSLPMGNVGFDGQHLDSVISMDDMRRREYDPSMQQYLQQDATGFGGGDGNDRRFVGNDPANRTDPSGLVPVWQNDNTYPPTIVSYLSNANVGRLYGGNVWRDIGTLGNPNWRAVPLSDVQWSSPIGLPSGTLGFGPRTVAW